MKPFLIFVNAMGSIVFLEKIIVARGLDITYCFQYLFTIFRLLIYLKLASESLNCTGVKNINNASIHYLMKHKAVVTTVVENLQNFWITKQIS